MLAAYVLRVEIPKQPIVIIDKLVQFPVPFFGQLFVKLLEEREQRPSGWEALLMGIDGNVLGPAELLSVLRKSETIEKVFSTYERYIPQARNPTWVFLDRNLHLQVLEQLAALLIV